MTRLQIVLSLILSLSSCAQYRYQRVEQLPKAITNNAVALVADVKSNQFEIYSFNGLSQGKTHKDITNDFYRFKNNQWQKLKMPKKSKPVLASTAVSIDHKVYLIGGYTVAADGMEKSVADIFEFDSLSEKWRVVTQMPVPVDDTVALVYSNRYIYLISGWHDTDNVSAVQVYDTLNNLWFNASSFPAPAVFGHAGGIIGNSLIICDGVKVVLNGKEKDFVSSPVCLKGEINKNNPRLIVWNKIPHHSNLAYYRMAATGHTKTHQVVFAGGSDNPYNYDGIGYDGNPSQASGNVFAYDFKQQLWVNYQGISPNMDHRALLSFGDDFYIVGGMNANQVVSSQVLKFKLVN